MKKNVILRKSAAILSAAVLSTTALSTGVFAADGFTDAAKSAVTECTESLTAEWDAALTRMANPMGAKATWTLALSDTGKSFGSLFGLDLSWHKDIKLLQNQRIENGNMYAQYELTINDGSVVTADMLFDTENMKIYMRVPELADGTVMVDAEQAFSEADQETGTNMSEIFQKIFTDPTAIYPSADELKELITAYSDLALANITDEAPEAMTITANGVSQEVTAYTGTLTGEQALETAKSIVDYAAADETLANVVNKLASMTGQDVSEQFQSSIADAQKQVAEAEAPTEGKIVATLYQDADGKNVGQSFAFYQNDTDAAAVEVTELTADDGSNKGVEITAVSDGQTVKIAGTGTSGDAFTGDLTVTVAETDVATIACENVSASAGSITLSLTDSAAELDQSLSAIAAFAIQLDYSGMEADSTASRLALSVLSGGTSLGTLSLDTEVADGPEIPSVESLGTIYDAANDTDMESFSANIDVNKILENVVAAGVPESFINQIMTLIGGGSEE